MDSTFQVRFGEDAYPISRFLVDRARALRLTRSDPSRRLGYRNIGSALKAQAIRDHYRTHNGHVAAFGAILSYTLVTLPGYPVDFGPPHTQRRGTASRYIGSNDYMRGRPIQMPIRTRTKSQ